MKRHLFLIYFAFLTLPIFWAGSVYGDSMTGGVYKMESDSINFGGSYSSSETFNMDDTAGEVGSGSSAGGEFSLDAGFLQTDEVGILALSVSDTYLSLSPSIGGITGGYSGGSIGVGVLTTNSAGYALYISAEETPAMKNGGGEILNYVPAGDYPDFEYTVANEASNFGFSPEGPDIVSDFKDNGSACGVGSSDSADRCWAGISTDLLQIAGAALSNSPNVSTTTVKFKVGVGMNAMQAEGVYYATTTITAIML